MISQAQAQALVPNKKAMYMALQRNQFIMPPQKDAIMTCKFMLGVKDGFYWCLRSQEVVTVKVCADPPARKDLAQILGDIMLNYRIMGEPHDSAFRRTGDLIKKHPPSVHWMLQVMSTIAQEHEIFAKNYVRPRRMPEQVQGPTVQIANPNGFFDDLPMTDRRGRGSRGVISMVDQRTRQ